MPTARTKSNRRYAVRKPQRGGARQAALPGWGELQQASAEGAERSGAFLETVSTARFALLVMALAAAFTLYVGHVHATQGILAEVQQQRRDNLRLHLKYNRLKGVFDRATSPAVVYERARLLGLQEDITYGPTLVVE